MPPRRLDRDKPLSRLISIGTVRLADGQAVAAADALAQAGIEPLVLEAKEGLALTNGTDGMLGMLCLACTDVAALLSAADVAAALSVEAFINHEKAG